MPMVTMQILACQVWPILLTLVLTGLDEGVFNDV